MMRRLSDEKPLAADPWGPRARPQPSGQGGGETVSEGLGVSEWVFAFMHRWEGSSSDSSDNDSNDEKGKGKKLRQSAAKKLDEVR